MKTKMKMANEKISKIRKCGNSFIITINKETVDELKLKDGNTIIYNIIEILRGEETMRSYACNICEYEFDSDEREVYCPSCESTNLKYMKNV